MHSTAIKRKKVSRPMDWIVNNLDLAGDILHFGEGKAYPDTSILSELGNVSVYEPYPHEAYPSKADLPSDEYFDFIISVYVLNVMTPHERDNAIDWMKAHGDVVIAAVRTDKINGVPSYDGVETSTGSFQKSFTKLDCETLGQVLVFKHGAYAIVEL